MSLNCKVFFESVKRSGIRWFTGVPDSLLKDFCAYVTDHAAADEHLIAANEGSSVGLAAGYYLATGEPAMVYLQNSGLGNTINPFTSLADPDVYGIPMLILIGWRGEPGRKDEPQHVKMGAVTRELLDAAGVPWAVLPGDAAEAEQVLEQATTSMRERQGPFALLVPKGTFEPYKLVGGTVSSYPLTREEAIGAFVDTLPEDALVVSTTGKPSRELFDHRVRAGDASGGADFLTVGSMGHSSQIALGVAMQQREQPVYCLDGDGAVLMHMGGLASIGTSGLSNFKHVVLNNGAHDSVGGQPTVGFTIDIPKIALACGYRSAHSASTLDEMRDGLKALAEAPGPALLELRIKTGARADLGRPTRTPREGRDLFMSAVKKG